MKMQNIRLPLKQRRAKKISATTAIQGNNALRFETIHQERLVRIFGVHWQMHHAEQAALNRRKIRSD
jgi:hypothetical protein